MIRANQEVRSFSLGERVTVAEILDVLKICKARHRPELKFWK